MWRTSISINIGILALHGGVQKLNRVLHTPVLHLVTIIKFQLKYHLAVSQKPAWSENTKYTSLYLVVCNINNGNLRLLSCTRVDILPPVLSDGADRCTHLQLQTERPTHIGLLFSH